MHKRFLVKFSIKNLWIRRTRTFFTLLGMSISFAAIVFLMSLAFGIEQLVTQEVTKGDAFVSIDVGTGGLELVSLTDKTIDDISNMKGVKNVASTKSIGAVAKNDEKTADVTLIGTSADYMNYSGLAVASGEGIGNGEKNVVINTTFANLLISEGPPIGQSISLDVVVPQGDEETDSNRTIPDQEFRIVGVVNDDSSAKVYVKYDSLRSYGITDYDQIKVEVASQSQVPEIRYNIENIGLKTQYIGDTVTEINQVFNLVRVLFVAFGSVALVVSLLGMVNMLTLSMMERIKEIAVLKVLGVRQKDLRQLLLVESAILGVGGGLLGIAVGVVGGWLVNLLLNQFVIQSDGFVPLFATPASFMVAIIVVSVIVGVITGLYPARKAIRVSALDALRYE